MQPYKGYFITSSAMPVHPLTRTGTLEQCVGTGVRRGSSIVEVTRFQFERLTVSIKENCRNGSGWRLLGSWWTNSCPSERTNGKYLCRSCPKCNGFGNRGSRTEASDQGRCLKCGCWRGFSKHYPIRKGQG